jgi:hypothetical protein
MEYEFIVVYKPRCTHVVADALSKLTNSIKPMGIHYQIIDAMLFHMGAIIVKRAKNHVKRPKNCQNFQTHLCNVTLMSCSSTKFVLNDLYER